MACESMGDEVMAEAIESGASNADDEKSEHTDDEKMVTSDTDDAGSDVVSGIATPEPFPIPVGPVIEPPPGGCVLDDAMSPDPECTPSPVDSKSSSSNTSSSNNSTGSDSDSSSDDGSASGADAMDEPMVADPGGPKVLVSAEQVWRTKYGKIVYYCSNPKRRFLVAHCECRHGLPKGKHCRLTKTVEEGKSNARAGQGRPLAFMLAWLAQGHDEVGLSTALDVLAEERKAAGKPVKTLQHVDYIPSFEERCLARTEIEDDVDGAAFSECVERRARDGEGLEPLYVP